ncbi:MAG: hypothetical protein ACRCUS_04670 [Anaerovoracaceae bacterium]
MQNMKRKTFIVGLLVIITVMGLAFNTISFASASETLPPGHSNWTGWVDTKAATCLEDGEKSNRCTYCGLIVTTTIPALGHDMVVEEKQSTCTEEGLKVGKCTRGDFEEVKSTPASGHFWGPWEEKEPATENKVGKKERVCGYDITHIEEQETVYSKPDKENPNIPGKDLPKPVVPITSPLSGNNETILSSKIDGNIQGEKLKNIEVDETAKAQIQKIYTEVLGKTSKMPSPKDLLLGLLLASTILGGTIALSPKSLQSMLKILKK